MIFVDSNVPMYLVGAAHPNKDRLRELLDELIRSRTRFVTDVEAYQEILHRYAAIGRLDAIDPAFDCMEAITEETLTFGMPEIRAARRLLASIEGVSARDALHVAVMQSVQVSRILSLDRGFDACPGIERLS